MAQFQASSTVGVICQPAGAGAAQSLARSTSYVDTARYWCLLPARESKLYGGSCASLMASTDAVKAKL